MHGKRSERVRDCYLFLLLIVLLLLPSLVLSLRAQAPSDTFVRWVQTNARRWRTTDPDDDFSDLRSLASSVANARIVALGETHGTHELLRLRNRFFQYLVKEFHFTAIGIESGVTETWLADAYALGDEVDEKEAARVLFSNNRTTVWSENLELIQWMRRYNREVPADRKLHIYGLDMSGQVAGDFTESRIAIDGALAYLAGINPEIASQFQKRFQPYLDRFHETFSTPKTPDYRSLDQADRDSLTAAIADLIALFERRGMDFIQVSSEREYIKGYRNAVAARQLDDHFRVRPEGKGVPPLDFAEAATARDAAMAENALWALHRSPTARLFVYAANGHLNRRPQEPDRRFFPAAAPKYMGEYLASALGSDLYVFGTGFRQADESLKISPLDPASFIGTLARVRFPIFSVDLRTALRIPTISSWFNQIKLQNGFDGFILLDKVTPAIPAR